MSNKGRLESKIWSVAKYKWVKSSWRKYLHDKRRLSLRGEGGTKVNADTPLIETCSIALTMELIH